MEKKLFRSRTDRMLLGVCGGLGKYLGIDPTIIRIIFVLLAFPGIGIVAYIVMAFIVPMEESKKTTPQGVVEENAEDIKETATKLGNEIRDTFARKGKEEDVDKVQMRRRNALGIIIIVIGVICLLGVFHLFSWIDWWGGIGAVALIGLGVLLIVGVRKK